MTYSAKLWDRVAQRYSKRPIADEAAYQKKLQVTRDYLRPGMEVLELGRGTGSTAVLRAPCVKHILAIDISSNMIEIARGKAGAEKIENITFERSAIEELDVPDRSLDAVLALSVLHLLSDWQAVISRVHNMLKRGRYLRNQHGVHWRFDEVLQDCRANWKILRSYAVSEGFHDEGTGRKYFRCRIQDRLPMATWQKQGRVHRGQESWIGADMPKRESTPGVKMHTGHAFNAMQCDGFFPKLRLRIGKGPLKRGA